MGHSMKTKKGSLNTQKTMKQFYGDISERKRKSMKEDMENIIKMVEELYPYEFNWEGKRYKNNNVDPRDHFLYCLAKYEEFSGIDPLPSDFIEGFFDFMDESFYMEYSDNYNKVIAYTEYLTNKSSTKKKADHELFVRLYDAYGLERVM